MSLWNYYLNNDKRIIDKWTHYFPIYERFLAPWVNKTVNFLEIGVSEGGSLQMWKSYLGPLSTIVGVDIDPSCKQIEENGIKIRIGDQSSESFLTSLVDEFGTFDVVIDDGSHQWHR